MKKTEQPRQGWLQTSALSATRVHFYYVVFFALSIVVFDSWNLFTHEAATQLWTAAGLLLAANTVLWYLSRRRFSNESAYRLIIMALVLAGIAFAGYNVLWQQGLASKAVALFAVPIITSALLRSRSAVLAAASLSAAAYSTIAIRYFFQNYGEGYRVELYGTVGFYSAMFFVLAMLLVTVVRQNSSVK